uniref:Uncharacterized protein n=1 Tax=Cacopsylla melanoneura TaxID=428564 RepID=A0A8D8PLP9_9HEMI
MSEEISQDRAYTIACIVFLFPSIKYLYLFVVSVIIRPLPSTSSLPLPLLSLTFPILSFLSSLYFLFYLPSTSSLHFPLLPLPLLSLLPCLYPFSFFFSPLLLSLFTSP